jgi:hypothetical protein
MKLPDNDEGASDVLNLLLLSPLPFCILKLGEEDNGDTSPPPPLPLIPRLLTSSFRGVDIVEETEESDSSATLAKRAMAAAASSSLGVALSNRCFSKSCPDRVWAGLGRG